jgi:hypothetical protein
MAVRFAGDVEVGGCKCWSEEEYFIPALIDDYDE